MSTASSAQIPAMTGLVLAGGRSTRMGRDKAALEFEGEPLVTRLCRRLATLCDEVIVASGDGRRLGWARVSQVADARSGCGPLGGLVAGLDAAANDLVAVVAVDMPFASTDVLRLLANLRQDEEAVIALDARGPEPLHAVYAKAAAPSLRASLEAGRFAIWESLRPLRVRYVTGDVWSAADPAGSFAWNVNSPEDLASPPQEGGLPSGLRP